jgi:hypothetical protein
LVDGAWAVVWAADFCWESCEDPQSEAEKALTAARVDLTSFLKNPPEGNGGWVLRRSLGPEYIAAKQISK